MLDLDADGVHFGHLRVPHPTDRSAYGWVGVPVHCMKSGNGPTVTLTGAVHGDELEGTLVLEDLVAESRDTKIAGRVIVLPRVNILAYRSKKRLSPADGMNLNRVFPGDADGNYTQRLAALLVQRILAKSDYLIEQSADPRLAIIIDACSLEHNLIFQGRLDGSSLLVAAARSGAAAVSMELGGGAILNAAAMRTASVSVRNLLVRLGSRRLWHSISPQMFARLSFMSTARGISCTPNRTGSSFARPCWVI